MTSLLKETGLAGDGMADAGMDARFGVVYRYVDAVALVWCAVRVCMHPKGATNQVSHQLSAPLSDFILHFSDEMPLPRSPAAAAAAVAAVPDISSPSYY